MITKNEYLNDRIQSLKEIFNGYSTQWINKNIMYYPLDTPLTKKDFEGFIIKNIKNVKDENLIKLIYFITYSYIPFSIIKNIYPNVISPSLDLELKGLVKYYMFQENNNIYVTFRGTKTFWEVINALQFYRVKFNLLQHPSKFLFWKKKFLNNKYFDPLRIPLPSDNDIEIHKGFLDQANIIYIDFVNKIKDINIKNIVLTGHSLGGVLATIIGLYVSHQFPNKYNVSIITANMPPIGNKNFNLLIPYLKIKNYIRIYNYQDFIPFYGYYGSWIENKKFRHIDYMLKKGPKNQNNSQNRFSYIDLKNTKILIKDYGKNLDNFLSNLSSNINYRYIFHDIFVIKNKTMYI